jgi:Zn-dependent protease with chaperone function
MHRLALIAILAFLAACTTPISQGAQGLVQQSGTLHGEATFAEVASRVGPVAEAMCRERAVVRNCNFRLLIDNRLGQPPNAFQTVDRYDRPILGFNIALIEQARNADELAFVMGHEAAHHIAGHIPQREQAALSGALMGAILATAQGLPETEVQRAGQLGAAYGARQFSRDFELEADAIGTELALRAGYDAVRGSAFFDRLPDPGDRFLGTHPSNAARKALVQATQNRLLTGR